MLQPERLMLKDFESNIEHIVPMVEKFCLKHHNCENLLINTSPFLSQPLFTDNSINPRGISVSKLLGLCAKRWEQELNYREEILVLKDCLIEEYNKLSNKFSDDGLINFVMNQQKIVVEHIFQLVEFDRKQVGSEFCKSLMNGLEIEVLTAMYDYVAKILWGSLPTPYPVGLLEFIKNLFSYATGSTTITEIEGYTLKIMEFVTNYLAKKIIRNISLGSFQEINAQIKKSIGERKPCVLIIEKANDVLEIVQEERSNIDYIEVKLKAKNFIKANIPIAYESLELMELKKKINLHQVFLNIPKGLEKLKFNLEEHQNSDIENLASFVLKIFSLIKICFNFNKPFSHQSNHVNEDGLKIILASMGKFKKLNNLIINFRKKKIKYSEELGELVTNLKDRVANNIEIEVDEIEFANPKIKDENINTVAIFFHSITFLMKLNLDLSFGFMNDEQLIKLVSPLNEMSSITEFRLYLGYGMNKITSVGMASLAKSLSKMVNISYLLLSFYGGENEVNDEGVVELSKTLRHCKSMSTIILYLNGGRNKVTDNGIKELAKSIRKMKKITKLQLYFDGGNNDISNNGLRSLSKAIKKISSPFDFELYIKYNNSNNKVTKEGIQKIVDARKYKKLKIDNMFYFQ